MVSFITSVVTYTIIGILWILSDTITEFLSEGKPFASNELKSFK